MYFRSFYGLPSSMTSPDGRPVNAVRGLLDSIARLVAQYQPNQLACAWDNDWRPAWRVELVPTYKTHRVAEGGAGDDQAAQLGVVGAGALAATGGLAEESPDGLAPQVLIIREVLTALGIPIVGVDGYEADDVIGSLASQSQVPALAVTGDRDLFQLADGNTRVIYIGKGVAKHDLVDDDWVFSKYGVHAAQYVDFAVLRGDPSDGLPGVKGIGDKSAAQLVARYGDLEGMLAAAGDPASGMSPGLASKLGAAIDYLGPAREVVAVVRDLPVGGLDLRVGSDRVDVDGCARLAEQHGLGSSMERILAALAKVS